MEKLFSVCVVLVLASVSFGAAGFVSGGSSDVGVVAPGQILGVKLVSDLAAQGFTLTSVLDSAGNAGMVSDVVVHGGFDWPLFTGVVGTNTGGALILNATGKTNFGSPAVGKGSSLLSFDYRVPDVLGPLSIFAGPSSFVDNDVDLGSLTMTVVPEPATLVLLGVGGLLLRRRK